MVSWMGAAGWGDGVNLPGIESVHRDPAVTSTEFVQGIDDTGAMRTTTVLVVAN